MSSSSSRSKSTAKAEAEQPSDTIASPSALVTRCVLYARVSAATSRHGGAAYPEQAHAIQRCLKRMRRTAEAFGGRAYKPSVGGVLALFLSADAALQAACELHQRVGDLPPSAGVKLSSRTGLDFGTVVADEDQVYGESVDRAIALADVAQPDQIVATNEVVVRLSPAFASLGRAQESAAPNDGGAAVALFAFPVADISRTAASSALAPARMAQRHLLLTLGGDTVTVDARSTVRTLGRDIGNDISVNEPRASRTHARIELRGNGFVLVDVSRNGTFVQLDSGRQIVLRQEEMELPAQGQISLGRPCAADALCVSFEVVRE